MTLKIAELHHFSVRIPPGPDAAGVQPGAKVAVYPGIGCGQCAACRAGE